MNMGLFYGSSTCYTEMAAEKIRDIIGPELVTLHNLKDDSPKLMEQYDVLILGIPTWDFGEIQEDWEAVWDQLDDLNLEGKIVEIGRASCRERVSADRCRSRWSPYH